MSTNMEFGNPWDTAVSDSSKSGMGSRWRALFNSYSSTENDGVFLADAVIGSSIGDGENVHSGWFRGYWFSWSMDWYAIKDKVYSRF